MLAWMFVFTVGAIFTDVTDSVEEFVEEAWNDFVGALGGRDCGSVKLCFVCIWRMCRTACLILNYVDVGLLFFGCFQICLQNRESCGGRDVTVKADKQPATADEG